MWTIIQLIHDKLAYLHWPHKIVSIRDTMNHSIANKPIMALLFLFVFFFFLFFSSLHIIKYDSRFTIRIQWLVIISKYPIHYGSLVVDTGYRKFFQSIYETVKEFGAFFLNVKICLFLILRWNFFWMKIIIIHELLLCIHCNIKM